MSVRWMPGPTRTTQTPRRRNFKLGKFGLSPNLYLTLRALTSIYDMCHQEIKAANTTYLTPGIRAAFEQINSADTWREATKLQRETELQLRQRLRTALVEALKRQALTEHQTLEFISNVCSGPQGISMMKSLLTEAGCIHNNTRAIPGITLGLLIFHLQVNSTAVI